MTIETGIIDILANFHLFNFTAAGGGVTTEAELLKNLPTVIAQNQDFCLIASIQPDLKQIRNFVCLDTRSREVRNKTAGEA